MRPLSIRSLSLLSATVAALTVGACKGGDEAPSGESAPAAESGSAEAGGAAAPAASASAGEVAAASAGPAVVAPATGPATVDSLFELIPAGDNVTYVLVRDPGALFDYGVAASSYYDQPLEALSARAATPEGASLGDFAEASNDYAEVKRRIDSIQAELRGDAVDLQRGMAVVAVDGGDPVVIFGSAYPDKLGTLLTLLGAPPDKGTCKSLEGVSGYAICGENEAAISAYKPQGKDGASAKDTLQKALPGVAVDDAQIVASIKDDGQTVTMAVSVAAGDLAFHVGLPLADDDVIEAREVLASAKPDLMRFVQPGSGFVWANVDAAAVRKRNSDIDSLPPMFVKAVEQFTGEFLMGGSRDPAGFQIRLGARDVTAFQPAFDLALLAKNEVPKSIPGIKGSTLKFDRTQVDHDKAKVTALHLAAGKIPQLETLKARLGISLDLWLFAADGALSMVAGADATEVSRMMDGAEGSTSWLPPSLAKSLAAGEAAVVAHMPFDSLHGPLLPAFLAEAKERGADIDPELVRMMIGLSGPVSSSSLWVTDVNDTLVVHTSVQLIGDLTTDEGRAALEAAKLVATGGDSKALFDALAARYPDSPRSLSYKARAGEGGAGDLVSSALGALIGGGAFIPGLLVGGDATVEAPVVPEVTPVTPPSTKTTPAKDDTKDAVTKREEEAEAAKKAAEAAKKAAEAAKKAEEAKKAADEAKKAEETKDDTTTPVPRPDGPTVPIQKAKPKRVGRQPS